MARCTAKSKQAKRRCKNHAVVGFTVCRTHGGGSPVGIAHPSFKHGGKSRHHPMPTRLRETYEAALSDENLVELRADIALMDARLADVLKRVDSGEAGSIWAELREAQREADKAKDTEELRFALARMRELIMKGYGDTAAWTEVRSIIEQRRKLSESERKREVELRQVIPADQAMALMTAVIESVQRNVTDKVALARISRDVSAVLNRPG